MVKSGAFSNASIRGLYALTSLAERGRVPGASIGMLRFEGQGNISGQIITNMPGRTYQERQVQEGSVEGTLTVDESGLGFGRAEIVYRYGDGIVLTTAARFMINQAETSSTEAMAQSLTVMQEGLDPATGGLVTTFLTRLPDEGVFGLESLRGTYSGVGFAYGGLSPVSGTGYITFDGQGGTNASNVQNFPGANFGERVFVTFDTPAGQYTIGENGIGTITSAQEYEVGAVADLVVTRAKVIGGVKVAQEYFWFLRDLLPTGGLATSRISKQFPD
ncbi:hypothetical protein [Candidatus Thiosymbion oneisti]|uniref:hypothetical protein n=1 Tax=Candidatus Thiosymbion oneisti TaxID=589554 RepID=UPI00105DFA67|nr:hypothetical protein [Candidatus Thiosymbion oneisti]